MNFPIKPEKNDVPLNATLSPSIDKKLREFASNNSVSRSAAARYIIGLFFDTNFAQSELISPQADDKDGE